MSARGSSTGLLVALALLATGAGYLRGCTGPRPAVTAVRGEALLAGGVRAVASVRNAGGEGEVVVDFRLLDARTGRAYLGKATASLRAGEEAEVGTWIAAPAGEYRVEAEAEYPPR